MSNPFMFSDLKNRKLPWHESAIDWRALAERAASLLDEAAGESLSMSLSSRMSILAKEIDDAGKGDANR